jgi:hypothetical protein
MNIFFIPNNLLENLSFNMFGGPRASGRPWIKMCLE